MTHIHNFYDEQFEDGSVGFTCLTCGYFYHFEPRVKPKRKPFPYDNLVKEIYAEMLTRDLEAYRRFQKIAEAD